MAAVVRRVARDWKPEAVLAMTYVMAPYALGVPASRVKTVSYGKEFPFDPGHDDAAWAKNRRAHFVITGK